MPLEAGVHLGTFEIVEPLGAGGMGEVYRARDDRLGRDVAIKVLPESLADDPSRVARFEREARLLAAINHPGIAAIYGAEESGALRYIVMELVPGETLAGKLARDALPIDESLDIADQIAAALEAAHERGVVHRDLKPSNVMITPGGKVKLLDFGLAKAAAVRERNEGSDTITLGADRTQPGVILGTIEFMSPEQARGQEVDRRTDIWAFGCILFEMLSGRRAFKGATPSDALAAILRAEPDWTALPAATPPRIRELLERCLQKDPDRRLRDAGDARADIEQAETGSAPASPVKTSPGAWRTAAAALIGVLVVGAIWFGLRPTGGRSGKSGHPQLAVIPFRNLTGDESAQLMGMGFVETVSVRLSGVSGLQVVTPSVVVAALDRNRDDLRAARAVGANLVVLGTFQRQGDRVRITYRLVNAQNGSQIAANAIDGSASDLFSLQDTLAEVVANDLHLPGVQRHPARSSGLDAGQQLAYLQAIGLLQRYDRRDSVEQALSILRGLREKQPDSAIVLAALGRAHLAMFSFTLERGWGDDAVAMAEAARKLDPGLPEVDVILGQTLLATGRSREAAESFRRALATNPDDFEALLGLGQALERSGDDRGAEAFLRRAIELQPSSFAAFNHLGAFYFHRGQYREASDAFRRAAKLAPDSYTAQSNLGGASTMACDFAAANEAYQKALAIQPNNPDAISNLGITQLWTGHDVEATRSLERAVRYGPDDFRIWGNLGDAYAWQGRSEQAGRAYARALDLARGYLRLNPKDTQAHQVAASSLAKTGRVAEAEESMKRALALDPRDPDVLANAAIVAVLAGRDSEAIRWLRKAIEAGYCRAIALRQPEFSRLSKDPAFRSIVVPPHITGGS